MNDNKVLPRALTPPIKPIYLARNPNSKNNTVPTTRIKSMVQRCVDWVSRALEKKEMPNFFLYVSGFPET